MTQPTHTRRTSIYTLRFQNPTKVYRLAGLLPNVADLGDSSMSFRAASDEEAIEAAAQVPEPHDLTTGLGIHRRIVARHR